MSNNTKKSSLNLNNVYTPGHSAEDVFKEALNRWNGSAYNYSKLDIDLKNTTMQAMREQVEARFAYDYKANLNLETGEIVFNIGNDDDFDESNEESQLWSLEMRHGRNGGLKPDKHGSSIEEITHECEHICREYIWIALSYSAAGIVGD